MEVSVNYLLTETFLWAGNVTFLLRQESNQRRRHRRGAELLAPASKAALSYVPLPART